MGLFGIVKGSTCHPGSNNAALDLGNVQLAGLTCDVKSVPRRSTKLPRRWCTCLSRSEFVAGLSSCQQAVILEAPGLRELLTQISNQNKVLARSHEISSSIDLNQDPSLRIFFFHFFQSKHLTCSCKCADGSTYVNSSWPGNGSPQGILVSPVHMCGCVYVQRAHPYGTPFISIMTAHWWPFRRERKNSQVPLRRRLYLQLLAAWNYPTVDQRRVDLFENLT